MADKCFRELPPDALNNIRSAAKEFAGSGVQWMSKFALIYDQRHSLFNLLSLIIITPVVVFYLLRDLDLVLKKLIRGCHGARPQRSESNCRR